MTDGPTDIDILMSRIEEINHQQPPLAARDIDALRQIGAADFPVAPAKLGLVA